MGVIYPNVTDFHGNQNHSCLLSVYNSILHLSVIRVCKRSTLGRNLDQGDYHSNQ